MNKPAHPVHLEIQTHRGNPVGLLRSSFRDDHGKVKHQTLGRVTGRSLDELRLLQAALQGKAVPLDSPQSLKIVQAKEYGASAALLHLATQLGLDQLLYSRPEPWVKDALALIVGRVVYAGSKLALSHQWKNSALWELSGTTGPVDVEVHCYAAMDRLLERQPAIQKGLAAQHLHNGALVLYDITSSYLEGEYAESELVTFGYNRDGKRGHEQIVIGLLCAENGCPVGVEVFKGNTNDSKTVLPKLQELQQNYGLKEVFFVGDRGMVTQANAQLLKDQDGVHVISALTHRQIVDLLDRKVIQMGLFDERQIVEVSDPADPAHRYCLCRNPQTARQETATRQALLDATQKALEKMAQAKKRSQVERLSARVGRVLEKYKMGKFVQWSVQEGKLHWHFDEAAIKAEALLDGCYIIHTDASVQRLAKDQVVASYKKLTQVEQAFRSLKTVLLELRPIYHKTDARIRAHVFVCLLAYYLVWHLKERLQPLFAEDGEGKAREWTVSAVIQRLAMITQNRVQMGRVEFTQVASPDAEQQRILDLLKVKL